jgi:hypothetical protein
MIGPHICDVPFAGMNPSLAIESNDGVENCGTLA